MKTFHSLKIKTYLHETLNSSKGVIKKQRTLPVFKGRNIGWTKNLRCNWYKKNYQTIQTNTYILTINSPTIPKEIKIAYINEKIEQYIPNPLWCFKCQKFGHESVCNAHTICDKCGEKEPNHTTIDCKLNNKCATCGEDHPSYTRSCPVWKKEILTIKHTRNIPYPETRKIVEGYIKNKTYSQISPKSESKKGENYQKLISKLLQLGPKDCPKFIQEIKPILLKFSSNSTNPKRMTEHNPEKISQYIETNPSKQHPWEKSHNATGPDEILYEFLKQLPKILLQYLLQIFNNSWHSRNIPNSWKQATIIPIPKYARDITNPTNYQPIALTSCIFKTLEWMINNRLIWFLEKNKLITNLQTGFRKARSTIDHLILLKALIREAFAKKEHMTTIFFDIEKTYDTTGKYGIIRDLKNMGLKGRLPIFI